VIPSAISVEGATQFNDKLHVLCGVTFGQTDRQTAALLDPEDEDSTTVRASCEWWQGVTVGGQCCRSFGRYDTESVVLL
jgi:hypothetical protein